MKVWKIVSGIISIVLFFVVAFQGCAVGIATSLEESADVSGGAGLVVALLLLAGGIVSIATSGGGRGGHIAALIIFALAALISFVTPGAFADLKVWGVWCAVCAVLALIALLRTKKQLKGGAES